MRTFRIIFITGVLLLMLPSISFAATVTTFATLSGTYGGHQIVFDRAGNLYATNPNNNTVSKITPAGSVSVFANVAGNPLGIVIDNAGNLYTASYGNSKVSKITPSGTVSTLATIASLNSFLAIDASGNLYVASSGGIKKITPSGAVTNFATVPSPAKLIFDSVGNLYSVNTYNNSISKITPSGTTTTFPSGGIYPTAIAFDSAGNRYVSNMSNNSGNPTTITKITPSGALTLFATLPINAQTLELIFDASGNLYTANSFNRTVSKITTSGVVSTFVSVGNNKFAGNPTDLAFDSAGNLYTANYGDNTISKIVIAQTTGTVIVSSNISSSWTITGPATITGSGTSQTSASKSVGTYTITWGAVTGYTTPASQSLTLTSGGTTSFSGNYSLNSYTVSPSAGAGGTISPASRVVSYGNTTTFTVTPNAGYTASASGCAGSLSGTTYTTGAITGACTVSATYTLIDVFPTPPTISGPTTLITGHSGTYSFVSTDPQGDQVRYGIDWNMDGTADNWLPAFPNYEPSGTNLSMSYTWPTAGNKQFQALAQDYPGNNSAWTTYTITVSDPQPCTAGVVDSVNGWAPTCSTSATCLTPPDPAQLTNQPGIQIGLCPTPEYTGNTYRACSTATITCTPGPFCGDGTCNGLENILTCPADCKARYQQF